MWVIFTFLVLICLLLIRLQYLWSLLSCLGFGPHYPGTDFIDLKAQSASITWMSSEVSIFFFLFHSVPLYFSSFSDHIPSCARFQPWNIISESSSESKWGRRPWRHLCIRNTCFPSAALVITGYAIEECMIS